MDSATNAQNDVPVSVNRYVISDVRVITYLLSHYEIYPGNFGFTPVTKTNFSCVVILCD
jgi:hypothetical protein